MRCLFIRNKQRSVDPYCIWFLLLSTAPCIWIHLTSCYCCPVVSCQTWCVTVDGDLRWTAILKCFHRDPVRLRSDLWLGHSITFSFLSFASFQYSFKALLWIVVLLEGEFSALTSFIVSADDEHLEHDANTTMLHSGGSCPTLTHLLLNWPKVLAHMSDRRFSFSCDCLNRELL